MIKFDYAQLHRKVLSLHSLLPALTHSSAALPPVMIQLEVTHRCNLQCSMCFQAKNAQQKKELSTDEIKAVIDQTHPLSIITLTGGEPFLRRDFPEILRYVSARRRCNILTNAELIKPEHLPLLNDGKLALIGISLDGIGTTHDVVRNKKGLFDHVITVVNELQAYKHLRCARFPLLDIKAVILKENLAQLYDLLILAQKVGADFFSLSLPKLSVRQFNEPYYTDMSRDILSTKPLLPTPLSSDESKLLRENIVRIKAYRGPVKVRFYPYHMLDEDRVLSYFSAGVRSIDFLPCRIPWSLMGISPYGDVFPCLSYHIGTLQHDSLHTLWNSSRYRDFRSKLSRKSLNECCLGCCYSDFNVSGHGSTRKETL